MDDPLVYLNGAMTPLSEAKIPVLDRGFIFGDGVYDVIPVYGRRMFRAGGHLARLFRSLDAVGIPNPHDKTQWMQLIECVIAAHPAPDQLVYLQVTRGVAKRGHAFPQQATPTVFIMSNPLTLPAQAAREQGVACISAEDQRWLRCDIKSTSLLGNVLAAQQAAAQQAAETIQFRNGWLTEGSASNVWIAKDGKVLGPRRDNLILEGIRYGLLEELCASCGIAFEARQIAKSEVLAADEVLLTSASKEVLPVVRIDAQMIGSGKPGPIYQKLLTAYQAAKQASETAPAA